jgi:hypothetical protein
MKSRTVAALVTGAALSGALLSGAAVNAATSGVTYYGCLKHGSLSSVGTFTPECGRGSTVISWNRTGPQGPQGVPGLPGAAGSAGSAGAAGAAGPAGPSNGYFDTAGISSLPPNQLSIPVQTMTEAQAGNYLVTGSVTVSDPDDGIDTVLSCYLSMASRQSPTVRLSVPDGHDAGGTLATLPLTYAYSDVPAGVHISINCWSTFGPEDVVNATVTAVKVGSLT